MSNTKTEMPCCDVMFLLSLFITCLIVTAASASNFYQDFDVIFGDHRAQILNGGKLLTLSQDYISGSGFKSKNQYLYGRFDMQMKLPAGNTAGTVTAFYLTSSGYGHDEIDMEFLGNSTGEPYTLHTNVYGQGTGGREQQFHLWFDPTKNFHTYSVVWNIHRIIFLVDNIPIRVYKNLDLLDVPFPTNKPMTIYNTFWNGEQWATQGGLVKTDWSQAPFTASYRNFSINACLESSHGSSSPTFNCVSTSTDTSKIDDSWQSLELDATGRNRLRWVHKKFMIYDYCTDRKRFPHGHLPRECKHSRF